MRITVLAVGRARPPFVEPEAHYLKLTRPRQRVEVIEVRGLTLVVRPHEPAVKLESGPGPGEGEV